jgi:hypothetical protein
MIELAQTCFDCFNVEDLSTSTISGTFSLIFREVCVMSDTNCSEDDSPKPIILEWAKLIAALDRYRHSKF